MTDIVLIIVVGLVLTSGFWVTVFDDTAEIAIKAGLEECPIEKDSLKTIWVKDCKVYLETRESLK